MPIICKNGKRLQIISEAITEIMQIYQERHEEKTKNLIEEVLQLYNDEAGLPTSLDNPNPKHIFDIKCDFCDSYVEKVSSIPKGWLSARMRKKENIYNGGVPSFTELVSLPIMCPYHVQKTKDILNGF